jgi:tRNA pseudouridine55 synthase
MNRVFVTNKPTGISSNSYLRKIKKRYGVKKAGYSGTLDPFASGCLIVAFNQYTKLFRFFKKIPKRYIATLHLGAKSPTLDTEKIEKIYEIKPTEEETIKKIFQDMIGEIEYFPPKYSAKKIEGKKAYELAREGKEFELKKIKSTIYELKLISYEHPYITFDIAVSEGAYIRSIAQIISKSLGTVGLLNYLERKKEGDFVYENEKFLNPISYLKTKSNRYLKDISDISLGKKLRKEDFEMSFNGEYHILNNEYLSIIKIENQTVSYLINNIRLDTC